MNYIHALRLVGVRKVGRIYPSMGVRGGSCPPPFVFRCPTFDSEKEIKKIRKKRRKREKKGGKVPICPPPPLKNSCGRPCTHHIAYRTSYIYQKYEYGLSLWPNIITRLLGDFLHRPPHSHTLLGFFNTVLSVPKDPPPHFRVVI